MGQRISGTAHAYLNNVFVHVWLTAKDFERPPLSQWADTEMVTRIISGFGKLPALFLRKACSIQGGRQEIFQQILCDMGGISKLGLAPLDWRTIGTGGAIIIKASGRRYLALAQLGGQNVQHRASGCEDLIARSQAVMLGGVPREFGQERDHCFISTLRGSLGEIRLRGDVSQAMEPG